MYITSLQDLQYMVTNISNIVGKTLAFTSIKFMNDKDEVFARGSHTK